MATINGGAGADTLGGTNGADVIAAGSGPDLIGAAKGDDTVSGGGGDDQVSGGAGDDVIYGFSRADLKAGSGTIDITLMAGGFGAPVFAGSPPGDGSRLFVVEKASGEIRIMDTATGDVLATAFLDIPNDEFSASGEGGVLGLAFHPDYAENGRFFVNLTLPNGDIQVREYQVSADPSVAEPAMVRTIITIPHRDASNHNGGWIGFGPDGMLYIATGDGGGGGDPENDAQDLTGLLGKMLRIDVDGDDFGGAARNYAIPDDNPFADGTGGDADEIWAYGLRNPWRSSFDRLTGDLYIGDVGQGAWEEINLIAAGAPGGQNFGWHVKEGRHVFDDDTPGNPDPDDPSLIDPLVELPHDGGPFGGFAVTGGYVYRGPGGGQGVYFFADYVTGNFLSFVNADGEAVDFANRNGQLTGDVGGFGSIASFAEDGAGRLYGVSLNGDIFLIAPSAAAGDGADRLDGGDGADSLYGGAGRDRLSGGAADDVLHGGMEADTLIGGGGVDRLKGQDGADTLNGGGGRDELEGGDGADVFFYRSVTDSTAAQADRILDLSAGDRISLKAIDADVTQAGDQAFELVAQLTGQAGQAALAFQAARDRTVLRLDVDGDAVADAVIYLSGDQSGFDNFVL